MAELRGLKDRFTLDDLTMRKANKWALRCGLLASIQIVIDTAQLYGMLDRLDDFGTFARKIVKYL